MDDRNRMDPPGGNFSGTTPLVRPDPARTQIRPAVTPPAGRGPAPKPKPPRRGIPTWVWLVSAGGLLLIAVVALVLIYFITRPSSFEMVVKGAPPGSDVYVDNISRGVTALGCSTKVTGL